LLDSLLQEIEKEGCFPRGKWKGMGGELTRALK